MSYIDSKKLNLSYVKAINHSNVVHKLQLSLSPPAQVSFETFVTYGNFMLLIAEVRQIVQDHIALI